MELENRIVDSDNDSRGISGNGGDKEKSSGDVAQEIMAADALEKEPMESTTHTLSPRNNGLLLAGLLAFHFYDGCQHQNNLTHHTLQRFYLIYSRRGEL